MCLILTAVEPNPRFSLVVAANRDEFFTRPTLEAGFWGDSPLILSGRDLLGGGTWLGLTRDLRFAAVTNFRDPRGFRKDALSRGSLVTDFLSEPECTPEAYLQKLSPSFNDYNGFNLLVGDTESLWWTSNRSDQLLKLTPGIHGLSNHLLDTDWPKVRQGKLALREALCEDPMNPESFFQLLGDRTEAPDERLPETGVGLALERALSPRFVHIPATGYGTRCSTLVWVERSGAVTFIERRFGPDGGVSGESRFEFKAEVGA